MRGDFTKFSHKPGKHFAGVYMQQGRVQLDADWNEQVDIQALFDRTVNRDVIGMTGVPKGSGAFLVELTPDGQDLKVSNGRIYVDGLPFEIAPEPVSLTVPGGASATTAVARSLTLDGVPLAVGQWIEVYSESGAPAAQVRKISAIAQATGTVTFAAAVAGFGGLANVRMRRVATYRTQPLLPDTTLALGPQDHRTDLVYLDVWQRHVTAVEDPEIREKALEGPDTATRLQTVCQVKIIRGVSADCKAAVTGYPPDASRGRLSTRVDTTSKPDDACSILAAPGYSGLENRLYRVEIHTAGNITGAGGTAATFKWSRDNGSVVFPVVEFSASDPKKIVLSQLAVDKALAVRKGDWVELSSDGSELRGEAGLLAQVADIDFGRQSIVLDRAVTPIPLDAHPKVRRWDQAGAGLPVTAGPIALEDNILIEFTGANFKVGDSWSFAARSFDASVEQLVEAPPQSIRHSYCRLATITWHAGAGNTFTIEVKDCRPPFPPLTAIAASDVSYDNSQCKLPDTDSVQDAIDRLCAERDLRFHNKHLHGWGIVCGLQVNCAAADPADKKRKQVNVRPGYAIDCEGNDIRLTQAVLVPVLDLLRKWEQQHPGKPILNQSGNGDVCLTLTRAQDGTVAFDVMPYQPAKGWQALFQDTIWEDVVTQCFAPLAVFWQQQFAAPAGPGQVVTPGQKRFIALMNLVIQFINKIWGQGVYLSRREHDILSELYAAIRTILASKTYCAMFDHARPFPNYPFDAHKTTTIFGKDYHFRLRVHPNGKLAYSFGQGNVIHVYDLEKDEMVREVEFPGGKGMQLMDIAVTENGKLYAVAKASATSSLFATADIKGDNLEWKPAEPVCDVFVTALGVHAKKPGVVYAIGRGLGLYELTPGAIPAKLQPLVPFNACGHLEIAELQQGVIAFMTVGVANTLSYNAVLAHALTGNGLSGQAGKDTTIGLAGRAGTDGIAVYASTQAAGSRLAVELDPAATGGSKDVAIYALPNVANPTIVTNAAWKDTELILGVSPTTSHVMVARMEHYRMDLIDLGNNQLAADAYPLQIAPFWLQSNPRTGNLYAVNMASSTIMEIPATELAPANRIPMATLMKYRVDIIEAFIDLAGGLLQYIKDCICDRLLVDCPTCNADDIIKLACVQFREGQIEKVCNFAERKYVKTFPTVEYWLSLVPVLPLVKALVQQFCCLALPLHFGNWRAPAPPITAGMETTNTMKAMEYVGALKYAKSFSLSDTITAQKAKMPGVGMLLGDSVRERLARIPEVTKTVDVQPAATIGQPTTDVKRRFEANEVNVTVLPYERQTMTANVLDFATAPASVPAGAQITLFEENGQVKYYSLTKPETTAGVPALREEVQNLRGTVTDLQQSRERAAVLETQVADLKRATDDAAALRAQVAAMKQAVDQASTLQAQVTAMKQAVDQAATLQAQVTAMKQAVDQAATLQAQVADLKRVADDAAALRAQVTKLQDAQATHTVEVQRRDQQITDLKSQIDVIRRQLPQR